MCNELTGGDIPHTFWTDVPTYLGWIGWEFVDIVVFQGTMIDPFFSPFFSSIFHTEMLVTTTLLALLLEATSFMLWFREKTFTMSWLMVASR